MAAAAGKSIKLGLAVALVLIPSLALGVTRSGDTVVERGTIDDDFYAAAGTVELDAEIAGDAVVAGGEITIGHRIQGDVIAAGGTVQIRGEIGDDVRIAGGDLDIDAVIGDDLAASGGSIRVASGSRVGGDAWLAGGEVLLAGTVDGNLRITAGEIRLAGIVRGNVELEGGQIEILDGARIDGNLHTVGPQPAHTAAGAQIAGQVSHTEGEADYAGGGFGLFFSLTLIVAGILLYLLFPHYTRAAARRAATDPWASLGIGFVCLVLIPLAALILMVIVLGLWVGLCLLAMYLVGLLVGFLVGCFFAAERIAALFRQKLDSTGRRLISVALVILLLGLVKAIPLLGGLVLLILLLLGLGAAVIQLRYVYRPLPAAS